MSIVGRCHRWACSSHGWGACGLCLCSTVLMCCSNTDKIRDIPPSAAATRSRACRSRASGCSMWCPTSATTIGARGAAKAPSAAASNSLSEGRRMIGPMSLLTTIAATRCLSTVDKRLPGLSTRRRVPTVDSSACMPQSVLLPPGRRTCAALATVSRGSAPGRTDPCPCAACCPPCPTCVATGASCPPTWAGLGGSQSAAHSGPGGGGRSSAPHPAPASGQGTQTPSRPAQHTEQRGGRPGFIRFAGPPTRHPVGSWRGGPCIAPHPPPAPPSGRIA